MHLVDIKTLIMKKQIVYALILVLVLGCERTSSISTKPIDTAKTGVSTVVLPINGFYYYSGEYWLDCAGVTVYNTVIRSAVPLTKDWTREGVAGGYFHVAQSTSDTTYSYLSDGTDNAYCGY